jgi:RimJ/RimL family protein N-acetyltransferase
MIEPVTLERAGGIVRLEPLTRAHVDPLLEIAHDPAIWTWWSIPPMSTRERMAAWVEKAIANREAGTELPFAVIHKASGAVAGCTRYMDIHEADRWLEIGWTWYGAAWQRTGVNTECKYLLLCHAFETLGMVRVQLKTDARNSRSRNAIGRLGARYEGTLRRVKIIHDGYIRDTAMYSIIDEEWPWMKQRLEAMMARPLEPRP